MFIHQPANSYKILGTHPKPEMLALITILMRQIRPSEIMKLERDVREKLLQQSLLIVDEVEYETFEAFGHDDLGDDDD